MKEILKRLWIFSMFIIIISFFWSTNIKAEHDHVNPPIYETPGLIKKPVPVYCGPTEMMLNTATERFNQVPLVVGEVIREQTGELLAMITVLIHKDGESDMSVVMTMINTGETCVLGYGRNLKFYNKES